MVLVELAWDRVAGHCSFASRVGWGVVIPLGREFALGDRTEGGPGRSPGRAPRDCLGSDVVGASVAPAALRAARERAGLTQHQLARLVGVAGGERVSRWELGTSEPRPEILVRLAKVLDVEAMDLLDVEAGVNLRALRFAVASPPARSRRTPTCPSGPTSAGRPADGRGCLTRPRLLPSPLCSRSAGRHFARPSNSPATRDMAEGHLGLWLAFQQSLCATGH